MSRTSGDIDSDIEQQLSSDEELFARMADGVDDEEETPEVEEPKPVTQTVPEPEEEEDLPTNEPEEEEYEDEEEEEVATNPIEVVNVYTSEELKDLLADGDFNKLDTSRLSEEGKLVMKSMQSGLTPKLQEAAELRREMKELKESVQKAIPKALPKDIFEAYDEDPDGVTKYVNNKINELIGQGVSGVELEQMRETREQLRDHHIRSASKVNTQVDAPVQYANELLRAIPDIDKKQNQLRDYAIDVMGFTPDELAYETDLAQGETALRQIVRINNAYDKHMAPQRAQAKRKKKVATSVEKSGGGFKSNETTNRDRITAAKKSGQPNDWMDVFLNMED